MRDYLIAFLFIELATISFIPMGCGDSQAASPEPTPIATITVTEAGLPILEAQRLKK